MTSVYKKLEDIRAQMRQVYTETTFDHALNPRNMGRPEYADSSGRSTASDGDAMEIWLKVRDGVITGIAFTTTGCAATIASGSMVTELAKGKSVYEAQKITSLAIISALGGLPEGNVHCAELAANTLKKAISNYLIFKREPWKKTYGIY